VLGIAQQVDEDLQQLVPVDEEGRHVFVLALDADALPLEGDR
jgi:hypothetical protein